ncbi:MAG: hypothetical protein EBV06_00620 [Planctomycetia bacterium]|nr:hypothetical protein [Planctomycetia bacterium]
MRDSGTGERVPIDGQSGVRLGATVWIDEDASIGVQLGGFLLSRVSSGSAFRSDSNGNPSLAQPIIDANTGIQFPLFISDPAIGPLTGTYANASTSRLFGWEVNGVFDTAMSSGPLKVRGLVGFRQIGLRESYSESVTIQNPQGTPFALTFGGTTSLGLSTLDSFRADTDFYGVQVGTRVGYHFGRVDVDVTGKLAMGVSQQRVNISGLTTDVSGAALLGGLRALSSNIGSHTSNDFAVAPEIGLNVSYQVAKGVSLRAGYNFLYLSRVVRPTNQIDLVTNPGLVPSDPSFGTIGGPSRPHYDRQAADFWVHGLSAGLTLEF